MIALACEIFTGLMLVMWLAAAAMWLWDERDFADLVNVYHPSKPGDGEWNT